MHGEDLAGLIARTAVGVGARPAVRVLDPLSAVVAGMDDGGGEAVLAVTGLRCVRLAASSMCPGVARSPRPTATTPTAGRVMLLRARIFTTGDSSSGLRPLRIRGGRCAPRRYLEVARAYR